MLLCSIKIVSNTLKVKSNSVPWKGLLNKCKLFRRFEWIFIHFCLFALYREDVQICLFKQFLFYKMVKKLNEMFDNSEIFANPTSITSAHILLFWRFVLWWSAIFITNLKNPILLAFLNDLIINIQTYNVIYLLLIKIFVLLNW